MATRRGHYEDLLNCMICFEKYLNPKMLQCGHTFCAECLHGYFKTYRQQRRAYPGKLPCPTCRELTTLPSSGVSGLRNDFKVKKIEEMFKTMNVQNRASSGTCDLCRSQKKSSSAAVFCASCSMNYCGSCVRKHNKNPLFESHQMMDKSSDSTASSDFTCKVHSGERGKYFCRTCETVTCTVCIMSGHEDHNIVEIETMYRQLQQDIKNLTNIVEAQLTRLREKAKDLESLRELNLSSCQAAEMSVKEKTREMIEKVKRQESEILEELRRKRDLKLELIAQELDSVNFHAAKAFGLSEFATNTGNRNSWRKIAVSEELIQRMRTVAESDVTVLSGNLQSVLTFLPGHQTVSLGRVDEARGTPEQLSRGDIVLSPGASRVRVLPLLSQSLSEGSSTRPSVLLNINRYGKNKGEVRDPLGVACLLSGEIVVTEWGNKRVQIFDSVGKHVDVIASGQIAPQGVAVTLKGNIIITDGHNKRLQVFSANGSSMAKWGLGKFFGPCGVTISPNGNCVVTDVAEHKVSIFRGEKTIIKRFGGRGSRDDQFSNPLYLCSGKHNEIIVSDSDNHVVKVFDSSGRFMWKFGGEGDADGQLRYPRGVCTDQEGNLIVADRNNDRVSLFSNTGAFLRHLLTKEDGIRDPYGVAISITGNLVITESSNNRAAIKMFQL